MALGNALGMHEKTACSFWNAWGVYRKLGKSRGRLMACVSTDLEGSMILGEPCPFHCLIKARLFSLAEQTKTCCDLSTASSSASLFLLHTLSVQSCSHQPCAVPLHVPSWLCLCQCLHHTGSSPLHCAYCSHGPGDADRSCFLPSCFCKGFFLLSQCLLDHLPYTTQSSSLQVLQRRFSWVGDSEKTKKLIVFLVEECFPSRVSGERIRKIDKVIHGTRKIPVLSSLTYVTKPIIHPLSGIWIIGKTLWPPFSFLLRHIKTS